MYKLRNVTSELTNSLDISSLLLIACLLRTSLSSHTLGFIITSDLTICSFIKYSKSAHIHSRNEAEPYKHSSAGKLLNVRNVMRKWRHTENSLNAGVRQSRLDARWTFKSYSFR